MYRHMLYVAVLLLLTPLNLGAQEPELTPIVVQAPSAADDLRNLPTRPLLTTLPEVAVRTGGIEPVVHAQPGPSTASSASLFDHGGSDSVLADASTQPTEATAVTAHRETQMSQSSSAAYLRSVVQSVVDRDSDTTPRESAATRDTTDVLGRLPTDKAGNPVRPPGSSQSPGGTSSRFSDPSASGTLPPPYAEQPRIFPQDSPLQLRVDTAARAYRERGTARKLNVGQMTVYPYGHITPQVETQLLRVTLIELAPGEHMVDTFLGDAARFQVDTGLSGSEDNFTQLVSIKPLDCGLVTNMAITTNVGRTYALDLTSQPCDLEAGELPTGDYTRHVRWYYPDGTVDRSHATHQRHSSPTVTDFGGPPNRRPASFGSVDASSGRAGAMPAEQATPMGRGGGAYYSSRSPSNEVRLPPGSVNLEDLNMNYRVRTDRRFPCEPQMVGDDGQRTYILMDSDDPLCRETFPVYEEREGRDLAMVNYDVLDGYKYVIEGLHMRLVMLDRNASSGREQRVRIENIDLRDRLRNRGRSGQSR